MIKSLKYIVIFKTVMAYFSKAFLKYMSMAFLMQIESSTNTILIDQVDQCQVVKKTQLKSFIPN